MKKLIIPAFFFLISCSVVPMTGRKQFLAIPSSQMIALSSESYSQVLSEATLSTNTKAEALFVTTPSVTSTVAVPSSSSTQL